MASGKGVAIDTLVCKNEKNLKSKQLLARLPVKLSSLPPSLSASPSVTAPAVNGTSESPPLLIAVPEPRQQPKKRVSSAWAVFASTFATIFLAEIGDKTQLTTLLMVAQSHHPGVVFVGAGSALVLTSFLGVWLGQWLASRIAPRTLERAAGASLLLMATMLTWDVLH